MYILSRIILGSVRAAVQTKTVPEFKYAYQAYAAICWGIVMYLFHYQKGSLQNSLIASMTYLYEESDVWPTDTDFFGWFLQ